MIESEVIMARESCQCGGGCHSAAASLTAGAQRGSHVCPRRYLALTGFVLGAFLVLHLAINALGAWPSRYQSVVNQIQRLGYVLPALEIGLVFVPLIIHVALGLGTLRREKLRFGVEKRHHGSNLRQWVQRVTALVLLAFLAFHLATLHRWGLHWVYRLTNWPLLGRYAAGGLFDPSRAFASTHESLGRFWSAAAGDPANLLVAEFYLLGVAAAVYHLANGMAVGAEVLSSSMTAKAQRDWWHLCIYAGFALGGIGLAAWYELALKS